MRKAQLSLWPLEGGEQGLGNVALLDLPLTAFFASRQCPGIAIRAAMNWAVEQARAKHPVISGFHSPLEQSVLEVLFTAKAPCIIVIARKLEEALLPPAWLQALEQGTAVVIGMAPTTQRLTAELAARRNDWVAQRATRIVIAHAAAGGGLAQHVATWQQAGRPIEYLLNTIK